MKQIKALDRATKERIQARINILPIGDIKKLKGHTNSFRLRVGDYRVLFELDGNIIFITAVLPRGEAYKKI